jgi:hypothetical protein
VLGLRHFRRSEFQPTTVTRGLAKSVDMGWKFGQIPTVTTTDRGTSAAATSEEQKRQLDFWRALGPLIDEACAALELLPARYAERVLQALQSGDNRYLDIYFRKQLGRERRPAELLALFKILSRSETWRRVKGLELTKYLGRSVWLEGRSIRDGWEREGTLTPEQREMEVQAARELDRSRTRVLRPDLQLERKEAREFRVRVLERVYARIRETGRKRDCEILGLLQRGRSPAQAISELGLKMAAWEALKRKMERWGAQEREILRSEMSSRRVSAA